MIESQQLIAELGTLSYIGIWFVSLFSNIVIPVPEELVLLTLGYLAGTGHVSIVILLPLVLSGLLVSDIIMYILARKGSRAVTWLYKKFFSKRLLDKSDDWLTSHMHKIIFFSRFLVQLRFIGPFIAGQKRVPIRTFILYDTLALAIYVPLYTFLGLFFHNRVQSILENVDVIRNIAFICTGILVMSVLLRRYIRKLLFRDSTRGIKKIPT